LNVNAGVSRVARAVLLCLGLALWAAPGAHDVHAQVDGKPAIRGPAVLARVDGCRPGSGSGNAGVWKPRADRAPGEGERPADRAQVDAMPADHDPAGPADRAQVDARKMSRSSGCFTDASIWSPPGVPGADHQVIIQPGHVVTFHDFQVVRSLRVETGAALVTRGPSGQAHLHALGDIINLGSILGSTPGEPASDSVPGGSVVLTLGGRLENHGQIRGGDSTGDARGGLVRVHARGDLANRRGAIILGGRGGSPRDETGVSGSDGGEGGLVDLIAAGRLINLGTIHGGAGGGTGAEDPAPGGFVYVEGKEGLLNAGDVRGGMGGFARWRACGEPGAVMVVGSRIRVEGRRAAVVGGCLTLQADRGPVALHNLAGGAIQAVAGPLVVLAAGAVDLTGNPPTPVQRIFGLHGQTVLADAVVCDPDATVSDLVVPPPVVQPRARVEQVAGAPGDAVGASTAATPDRWPHQDRPITLRVTAPGHPGCYFQLAAALTGRLGLILDGFGVAPVDPDPLLVWSTRNRSPFEGFSGRLDEYGQAVITVRLPEALQTADRTSVHVTALVFDHQALCNLAPATLVELGDVDRRETTSARAD
jgi:hypothetical protein